MMNKTTLAAVVLSIAALIVGVIGFTRTPDITAGPVGPQGAQGSQGVRGERGPQGIPGSRGPSGADASLQLGAVPTLDGVQSPFVTINGVSQYYYNQQITATSSTFCSIRNPFNATSTLRSYRVQANKGILGSALAFDVATSTTALATSTPAFIASYVIPSALGFSAVWGNGLATTTTSKLIGLSPTQTLGGLNNGASDNIIRSGEYINAKIATTTAGTFAGGYFQGYCSGLIEKL